MGPSMPESGPPPRPEPPLGRPCVVHDEHIARAARVRADEPQQRGDVAGVIPGGVAQDLRDAAHRPGHLLDHGVEVLAPDREHQLLELVVAGGPAFPSANGATEPLVAQRQFRYRRREAAALIGTALVSGTLADTNGAGCLTGTMPAVPSQRRLLCAVSF